MNPKLKPSWPGLFELLQLQTASLIYISEKSPTNISLSSPEIELKLILSNVN